MEGRVNWPTSGQTCVTSLPMITRTRRIQWACVFFIILGGVNAFAQLPVVRSNGVVNAASFVTPCEIVSGGIVTIFGENLAVSTVQFDRLPLPLELAGASVLIDGTPAPVFYVSPGQINAQVPHHIRSEGGTDQLVGISGTVSVVVRTPRGASAVVNVNATHDSIGVFTNSSSGCGHGSIINLGVDGTSHTVNARICSRCGSRWPQLPEVH